MLPRRLGRAVGLGALAAIVGLAIALAIVRLVRDYEPVKPRPFLAGTEPLIIAHRGASAHTTEHTLAAYEQAVAAGADVLELDLRLTADRVPVVAHDEDLDRPLDVPLPIARATVDELRRAVAKTHPDAEADTLLLTFDDVLAGFPDMRLNVELKDDGAALAAAVADRIVEHRAHERVLVASFHSRALRAFRDVAGERVATSAGTAEVIRFYGCYLVRLPCRPDYQALQIPPRPGPLNLTSPRFLRFAERHGLAVHYWTINDPEELRSLLALGADGIMTDDPEAAVAARAALARDR